MLLLFFGVPSITTNEVDNQPCGYLLRLLTVYYQCFRLLFLICALFLCRKRS